MEENATDFGNLLNDPAPTEGLPPAEPPVEPNDTGEPPAEPPAAKPETELVPRAALMDERRKRQELEQWVQQQKQAKPAEPLKQDQFGSQEEFLEALAERKAAEMFERMTKQQAEQQRQMAEREQVSSDTASLAKAGAAKYADFNEVVLNNETLPITDQMINAMLVLDSGPDIAYYLGKNPAEAARIAALPPTSQALQIKNLAQKVAAPPPASPQLPRTLTQTRSADGRFNANNAWAGPSPLNDILGNRS